MLQKVVKQSSSLREPVTPLSSTNGAGKTLRLRPEQPEDAAFLFKVYSSVRLEELAGVNWDTDSMQSFLEMQFRAMVTGYRNSFPGAEFGIIVDKGEDVGRMVIDRAEEEIRVVDLAILPERRNQGVGTELLRRVMEEATKTQKPVRLRASKAGRPSRWYARLGFEKIDDNGMLEHWEWRALA